MIKRSKQKPYWEMTTKELAETTRQFDDPNYNPPAVKPNARQLAQLRKWRKKRTSERSKLTLSLDQKLIKQADEYAVDHGVTVSDVVSDALRANDAKKIGMIGARHSFGHFWLS